jgi:hypothetical protein
LIALRPKTYTEILLTGIPHAGGLAMLAAEELETLGRWEQLRDVDAGIRAQLCRFILKNDPLR